MMIFFLWINHFKILIDAVNRQPERPEQEV